MDEIYSDVDNQIQFGMKSSAVEFGGNSTRVMDTSSGGEVKNSEKSEKSSKKKKVKRCLAELQSFLGSDNRNDTLGTLQSVLQHLKKQGPSCQDNAAAGSSDSALCLSQPGSQNTSSVPSNPDSEEVLDNQKNYNIQMEYDSCIVTDVSADIHMFLGYKKDDMVGHNIAEYLHAYDSEMLVVYIKELLMKQDKNDNQINDKFFIRFITSSSKQVVVHMKITSTELKEPVWSVGNSKISNPIKSYNYESNNIIISLDLSNVESAYFRFNDNALVEDRQFTFTHSLDYKFTYIDNNAVQLIGYLPQEVVDSSILEYIHQGDYGLLLEAYEQLLEQNNISNGVVFLDSVRFLLKNGEYIPVALELSCVSFSCELEHFIGKVRVLKGPNNLDVFGEESNSSSILVSGHSNVDTASVKKQIEIVLNKAASEAKFSSNKSSDTESNTESDPNSLAVGPETNTQCCEPQSSAKLSQLSEKEINKMYSSMVYFAAIQRFLGCEKHNLGDNLSLGTIYKDSIKMGDGSDLSSIRNLSEVASHTEYMAPIPSCNSSTKAVLLEEDPDHHNLSPPSTTWIHHALQQNISANIVQENVVTMGEQYDDHEQKDQPMMKLTQKNLARHERLERRKYIKAVQSDKELRGLYNTLRVKTKALGSLHEGVRKRQASCSIGDTDNTKTVNKLLKANCGAAVTPFKSANPVFRVTTPNCRSPYSVPFVGVGDHSAVSHMFQRPQYATTSPIVHPLLESSLRFGTNQSPITSQNYLYSTASNYQSSNLASNVDSGIGLSSSWGLKSSMSQPMLQNLDVKEYINSMAMNDMLDQDYGVGVLGDSSQQEGNTVRFGESGGLDGDSGGESAMSDEDSLDISLSDSCGISSSDNETTNNSIRTSATEPIWLANVNMESNLINEYEVDLNAANEKFNSEISAVIDQSCQLYAQVRDYEIDKMDISKDGDSDTSSLFIPHEVNKGDTYWKELASQQLKIREKCTSSSESENLCTLYSKQAPHHKRRRVKHRNIKKSTALPFSVYSVLSTKPSNKNGKHDRSRLLRTNKDNNEFMSEGSSKHSDESSSSLHSKEESSTHNSSSTNAYFNKTVSAAGYEPSVESLNMSYSCKSPSSFTYLHASTSSEPGENMQDENYMGQSSLTFVQLREFMSEIDLFQDEENYEKVIREEIDEVDMKKNETSKNRVDNYMASVKVMIEEAENQLKMERSSGMGGVDSGFQSSTWSYTNENSFSNPHHGQHLGYRERESMLKKNDSVKISGIGGQENNQQISSSGGWNSSGISCSGSYRKESSSGSDGPLNSPKSSSGSDGPLNSPKSFMNPEHSSSVLSGIENDKEKYTAH